MSKALKNIIYQIHLWAGLLAGITIFLICLSGTILTFEKEIHSFFNPKETSRIDPQALRIPLEQMIDSLKDRGEVQRITHQGDEQPVIINVKTSPDDRRGKNFILHPTTGEVLNDPQAKPGLMFFFFRLHRWLLAGPETWGATTVGVSTIIFGLLLLSGLYLWWPKSRTQLKNVLKINIKNKKRMLYDLHNTLGFYSLIPLMIMTLTGLCWSFGWYRDGLSQILGSQVFGERRIESVQIIPLEKKLELEELILAVNTHLPYPGTVSIQLERNPEMAYIVRKTPNSGLQSTDILFMNPYDKEIVQERLFKDRSLGSQINSLIRHLHTGEFFGLISKIIYFITCLIATTLPITGTWMWLNKLQKKKKAL